tara:strand:+ start:97 stop:648 length:552 start_codon:yes stop_codon:yes gene_type:complete
MQNFEQIENNKEQIHSLKDPVWIKITPEGKEILNKHNQALEESLNAIQTQLYKLLNTFGINPNPSLSAETNEHGWTCMPLTTVFQVFGQHLRMGNMQPPMEMTFHISQPSEDSSTQTLNLNQSVWVQMDEKSTQTYIKENTVFGRKPILQTDEEGSIKMQLWEVANLYYKNPELLSTLNYKIK